MIGCAMIDTILFDFDGTLVDSEPNYALSDCSMVAHFGGGLTPEEHEEYVGMGSVPFLNAMKERYGITAGLEEMKKVQDDFYLEIARKRTPLFPEMKRLLDALKERGVTMAIASGTAPYLLDELTELSGVKTYMDLILSAEEVEYSKPAPDVFLKAAELLGKKPENCLVLEDSINGAKAGVSAGMATMVLVSPFLKHRLDQYPSEAILLKGGIGEFTAESVLSRVRGPVR